MPNVFIVGATGYIGLPLAQALLRTGAYTVWGLARSAEKAKILTQNEIHPVIGDAGQPETYAPLLESAHIDLVIDAGRAVEHGQLILDTVVTEAKRREKILSARGSIGPKIGFLYVSGTWVQGSPARQVSDLQVPGPGLKALGTAEPAAIAVDRPAHEQKVLQAKDVLDVAVFRPAVVYGRGSWIFDAVWSPLLEGATKKSTAPAQVPIEKDTLMNVLHVDDLTEALVLAATRIGGLLGDWPVFDLMAERVAGQALAEAAAVALGFNGKVELVGAGGNPFLAAMSLRHNEDSERARAVLGWVPRRTSMLMGLDKTLNAWAALR